MIDCERLDNTIRGLLITRIELREENNIYIIGKHPKGIEEEVILIVASDAEKIWGPDNQSMRSFENIQKIDLVKNLE